MYEKIAQIPYCENQLNNKFFNKCFKQIPLGILTIFGEIINTWFSPRILAIILTFVILIMPFIIFGIKEQSIQPIKSIERFYQMKFIVLNFLHRIGYGLVLNVILYTIFRQSRPCLCDFDGLGEKPFGSHYGMPSGDALTGGIIAMFLIQEFPLKPFITRFLAILLMIFICMERVFMGYHSLGQVIIGVFFGIILHFYSIKIPQYILIIENLIQIITGFILLKIDKSLIFEENDTNNLFGWFFFGVSFIVFESLNLLQFYKKIFNFSYAKNNYIQMLQIISKKFHNQINKEMEDQTQINQNEFSQRNQRIENEDIKNLDHHLIDLKKRNNSFEEILQDHSIQDFEDVPLTLREDSQVILTQKINILEISDYFTTIIFFLVQMLILGFSFAWVQYGW
ncbi:hypothetical protein M0811_07608 [Anaeramoeba ignava]|uniref:Phosphatidic acid phosphatase type 2/haloperoxidase domain-containing protein n=1 Tax=Anaeramoeba ignava TaxID=1746090 RepID=A0A9Q0LNZ0_ANAIG|nr:hypothetical protein M0811_07608 [Anaeramoeba ignava]